MKRMSLNLDKVHKNYYQTIIRNNHGRKIYLKISCFEDIIRIIDCFYIDRPERNGVKAIPQKLKTFEFKQSELLNVIANELDKRFSDVIVFETENNITASQYIKNFESTKNKYKFLIFVQDGEILKTRIKNRVHRSIYLEIKISGEKGTITDCYYYDRKYKRDNCFITPADFNTIFFDYSIENILKIVNSELNCDFTDVLITKDSFGFNKTNFPLCGSI